MVPPIVLPPLYWSYWANTLFILGMFGYLMMDTVSYLSLSTEINLIATVYTFLALLFIVDAILYSIDWYMYAVEYRETPNHAIHYRADLVACIFHNIGSQCYFIGSLFGFSRTRFMKEFLLLNFIGILAFLFESGFTFIGWIVIFKQKPANHPRYTCTSQNVYLWAHSMNVIAASVYLCATALAYRFYVDYGLVDVKAVLILQMLGDLLYLFDAYLYYDYWLRDQQEYVLHNEREQLIELRLANEFLVDQSTRKTNTTSDEYDERDRIMDLSRNKS